MRDQCRQPSLAVFLGASLLAGCQPDGAGTISVDRQDPAVRGYKQFEDVKRPRSAEAARKPARQRTMPARIHDDKGFVAPGTPPAFVRRWSWKRTLFPDERPDEDQDRTVHPIAASR